MKPSLPPTLGIFDPAAWIRTILQGVPTVGAPLVQAWSEYLSTVQQQRISSFMAYLEQDLKEISIRTTRTSIELQHRMDLLSQAVRKSTLTRSEKKRKILARIAVNGLFSDREFEEFENAIDTVDLLNDYDLRMLESMNRVGSGILLSSSFIDLFNEIPDAAKRRSQAVSSLMKLQYRGLISNADSGYGRFAPDNPAPAGDWQTIWSTKEFVIMPMGTELCRCIQGVNS